MRTPPRAKHVSTSQMQSFHSVNALGGPCPCPRLLALSSGYLLVSQVDLSLGSRNRLASFSPSKALLETSIKIASWLVEYLSCRGQARTFLGFASPCRAEALPDLVLPELHVLEATPLGAVVASVKSVFRKDVTSLLLFLLLPPKCKG